MIDPFSSAFLVTKVVEATTAFVKGYADERAKVAATVSQRRQQYAFERDQAERKVTHEWRMEEQRAAVSFELSRQTALQERLRDLEQRQRDLYPIADGPGSLRSALLSAPSKTPPPLLVLLAPPQSEDERGQLWTGLRQRILGDLLQYQNEDLIRTRLIDRPFQWPHTALYEFDLQAFPTVILQISVDGRRLDIQMGGCHVWKDEPHVMRGIYTLRFPPLAEWTEADVRILSENASTGRRFRLQVPQTDEDLLELNHELASRVVSLCVATVIDGYYLMRVPAYQERFDAALSAAGFVADDQPADLSLPVDLVVDPAFHLLHSALRKVRRGAVDPAVQDIRDACAVVLGEYPAAPDEDELPLIERALNSVHLGNHHRAKLYEVVEGLPSDFPRRQALVECLTTPRPIPPAAEKEVVEQSVDAGSRVQAASPTAVDGATETRPPVGQTEWSERANRSPLD